MLHCYSISYQNTPLSIREQIDLSTDQLSCWLQQYRPHNVVVLSTCNRVELYTFADSELEASRLWQKLLNFQGFDSDDLAPYTVLLDDFEAAHHLFSVACSLRSIALGEAQILGQVSHALELAQLHGTAGHQLSILFRGAIHAAKRVHTETNINVGNVSISSLGIAKIESVLGSLRDTNFLVIGAGEMGQAVIKGLSHRGHTNVHLVSRTFEKAKHIANIWDITAYPMTQMKDLITQATVVFTTSSAPFPILNREDIEPIMAVRKGRELYMVDIAVPRDIAPEVTNLPKVHVFNIDDLQQVIDHNRKERELTIPLVHQIIEQELAALWLNLESLSVVPTIRQIREQAEDIRRSELQRIIGKLPPEERNEVTELFEEFSHRFMNKILHQPTQNLRASVGQGNTAMVMTVARNLFGLEDA